MVGAWVVGERGRLVLTLARDDACAEDCCFRRTAKNIHSYDRATAPKRGRLFARLTCLSRAPRQFAHESRKCERELPRTPATRHYETLTVTLDKRGGSARERDRVST